MHRRPVLTCALALLGGCNDGGPKTAPAPMAPTTPEPPAKARLDELRRLMQRSATLGGHGPLPQRSVSAQSIAAVSQALTPGDLPLLVELLGDDDALVRLMSTHLLARQDPSAAARVRASIDQAPEGVIKRRLQDALIDIELPQPPTSQLGG